MLEYYYPEEEEQAVMRLKGIPVTCRACGALLPQRRRTDGQKPGGRLREYCPDPGEPFARSRDTSCRVTTSQVLAVDLYLPRLPYPDTDEGRKQRKAHEELLLALRNTIHGAGLQGKRRPGAGQTQLF